MGKGGTLLIPNILNDTQHRVLDLHAEALICKQKAKASLKSSPWKPKDSVFHVRSYLCIFYCTFHLWLAERCGRRAERKRPDSLQKAICLHGFPIHEFDQPQIKASGCGEQLHLYWTYTDCFTVFLAAAKQLLPIAGTMSMAAAIGFWIIRNAEIT